MMTKPRRRCPTQSWTRASGLMTVFMLVACGGGDAPDTGAPTTDAPAEATSAAAPGGRDTGINAFEFTISGVEPVAETPTVGELTLAGGCTSTGPLSIGVVSGSPIDEDYFHFAMDSVEPVGRGQTGEVALSSITWDNGVKAPRNMPESAIRVPNRLEGPGTLTIESHSGVGMGGRMSGVVQGTLTDSGTGESADLVVSFDIDLACAM